MIALLQGYADAREDLGFTPEAALKIVSTNVPDAVELTLYLASREDEYWWSPAGARTLAEELIQVDRQISQDLKELS